MHSTYSHRVSSTTACRRSQLATKAGLCTNQTFLPADNYKTQESLEQIASWSKQNLVELNEKKCSYMVFTRTDEEFSTRLSINNCTIEKVPLHKILGLWISEDLSWEKNTKEICRKSYSRMSMLTKLKYIGTSIEDLILSNRQKKLFINYVLCPYIH